MLMSACVSAGKVAQVQKQFLGGQVSEMSEPQVLWVWGGKCVPFLKPPFSLNIQSTHI
jgi:hypothetical protein